VARLTPTPILVLNPGSSSLKASVISEPGDETLAREQIEWGVDEAAARRRQAELERLIGQLEAGLEGPLAAVGYRVVHGGLRFREPTIVDDSVLEAIAELDALAPLHNRVAVETIRVVRALLPDLPHVACFDSAFHASLPEEAWRYALPGEWVDRWGIRRFGFHGLSVAWAVERAAAQLARSVDDQQIVVAHLGSGCSVTAVAGGRSVATSMGYTPLEGLMMGTRSGSVDPGILLDLAGNGMSTEELADGLEHRSGLLGVSGTTASAERLEAAAASGDERAALALRMFCRSAAAAIAAASTALDRIDAVVFTGGIGEHSERLRTDICQRLRVLGVSDVGGPAVLVVAAREDLVVGRLTTACM